MDDVFAGTKAAEAATVNSSVSGHVNKYIQQVALKYCDESRKHFEELSKSMQVCIRKAADLLVALKHFKFLVVSLFCCTLRSLFNGPQ